MRAPESDPGDAEDSASWREQLALRLTRAFALLFAASTLIAATLLQGARERMSLVAMGAVFGGEPDRVGDGAFAAAGARSSQRRHDPGRTLDSNDLGHVPRAGHVRKLAADRDRAHGALTRARAEAEIGALAARQLETVGRLAAGVAHDFNNNLTAIMGCAQLLQLELPEGSSAQELVASIAQSSQRAADLTRQLLVYSRKAQMIMAPTDLHRLVEEAAALVRRSGDPRVSVELELHASRAVVAADATLLQSALLNLMLNARDAMPDGGRLTVATTSYELLRGADTESRGLAPGPCVLLEVRDTGAGIPAEVLPQIFEPFFTTKPVGRGSGLGLAAVAGAIKSHGGTIAVETELGSGTVFRVLLPLVQSTESHSTEASAQIVYGSGELLVVDDEQAVRNTVVATLRSLGYTVTAAPDGPTAIEAVRKERERFDLALLDLRMPHMTGETTFGRLRELSPSLPIVIWSGYGAGQDVGDMLRRGAAGFIQKPYRVAELSRLIATTKRS